ncbi:fimbrial protein [Salmonella enterica]|nr:fimbrial protein [Salmonella enterica]
MKKTLIALTLAVTTVSGSAMAWIEGDFNGSLDIGGSITPDKSGWQWKMEASQLSSLNLTTDTATESGGNIIWSKIGDAFPILMGKTLKAYKHSTGMSPLITYAGDGFNIRFPDNAAPVVSLAATGKTDPSKKGVLTFGMNMYALVSADYAAGPGIQQIADTSKTYGNGYLQNARYVNSLTASTIKNGIDKILGREAIIIAANATEKNYTGPNIFNNTVVSNIQGAYASEFADKSGTLTFPAAAGAPVDWKSSLTVTVSYQ